MAGGERSMQRSSTNVHMCPICMSESGGTSALSQHLYSAHRKFLRDHCPVTAAEMQWWEQSQVGSSQSAPLLPFVAPIQSAAQLTDTSPSAIMELALRQSDMGGVDGAHQQQPQQQLQPPAGISPTTFAFMKHWDKPMGTGFEVRWSTGVHSCAVCGSVHSGISGLVQHLWSKHGLSISKTGRWVHCVSCLCNFTNENSWRSHAKETNCPLSSLQIRWWEAVGGPEVRGGDAAVGHLMDTLIPLDGRSRTMIQLKREIKKEKQEDEEGQTRKRKYNSRARAGETLEEARERKQRCLLMNRQYMLPRPGFTIVRQRRNFRCTLCGETHFPTIPSLVWHQRQEHGKQLSQVEQWLHCEGCELDFASLSAIRDHFKAAAAAAAGRESDQLCQWRAVSISWQVESSSQDAIRFNAGMDPQPSGADAAVDAAMAAAVSAAAVAAPDTGASLLKVELVDEELSSGTQSDIERRRRRRNMRVDKQFMQPRAGYTIVRAQTEIVCQMCGESRFLTCSSLDHHMRSVHQSGIHQAGMWMHCVKCTIDFSNLSSVRTHLKHNTESTDQECCTWNDIFMCWQAKKDEATIEIINLLNSPSGVNGEVEEGNQPGSSLDSILANLEERAGTVQNPAQSVCVPERCVQEGFDVLRGSADVPCLICGLNCLTVPIFVAHVNGNHPGYFFETGAWLECRCGQQFLQMSAFKSHFKNGCTIADAVVCWKLPMDRRPQARTANAAATSIALPLPTSATPFALPTIPHGSIGRSSVEKEKHCGWEGMEREKCRGLQGSHAFDPTKHANGSVFVLRKKAAMECARCGEPRGVVWAPLDLKKHAEKQHGEQGLGGDRWLECAGCSLAFYSPDSHQQHLAVASAAGKEVCSMSDALLCWMEQLSKE